MRPLSEVVRGELVETLWVFILCALIVLCVLSVAPVRGSDRDARAALAFAVALSSQPKASPCPCGPSCPTGGDCGPGCRCPRPSRASAAPTRPSPAGPGWVWQPDAKWRGGGYWWRQPGATYGLGVQPVPRQTCAAPQFFAVPTPGLRFGGFSGGTGGSCGPGG